MRRVIYNVMGLVLGSLLFYVGRGIFRVSDDGDETVWLMGVCIWLVGILIFVWNTIQIVGGSL